MSERNGDKARFGRERKRKILLRKRIREFRKQLENNALGPPLAAREFVSIASLAIAPTG